MDASCHRPFLPGTSLEPAVIPTAQASSITFDNNDKTRQHNNYMYCHKDTKLDNMFRLTSSHHQVYTGGYKNHTGFFTRTS